MFHVSATAIILLHEGETTLAAELYNLEVSYDDYSVPEGRVHLQEKPFGGGHAVTEAEKC